MKKRSKFDILFGASALAVLLLLGYLILSGYREAILAAETTSRNYAAIIEARLDATLRRADVHLQELVRELPIAALGKEDVPRYARALDERLDLRLSNFPELVGLRVFDANGDLLYTSGRETAPPASGTGRKYFAQLRENPQADLVFSEAINARSSGQRLVVAARALRDGQGDFRGIVYAAINVGYFEKLFQSLNLGAHGIASVYRKDSFTLVARWPTIDGRTDIALPPRTPTRAAITSGNRSGTFEFLAPSDGVVRTYSFQVVDQYPFYVTVGLARDDVLADWRARSLVVGSLGLLLIGLLAAALYRLRRAEDSLVANEELMRSTFEQAAVGIAHMAASDGVILLANDTFCSLVGYTRADLIGRNARILTPPDDIPVRDAERASVLAGMVRTSSRERRFIRKDGSLLWVARSLSLVRDAAGNPRYFIAVIEDITERKKAQEIPAQLAAIVENSDDAIISRGIDGRCLSWNTAAERMFTYTAGEMIGRDIEFLIPADQGPLEAQMREMFRQGRTVAPYDTVRLAKGGRRIDVSATLSPMRDVGGKVVGFSLVYRDISERKAAAAALRAREEHYRQIFETAHEGIWVIDENNLTTLANARMGEILGCSARDLIGASMFDYMDETGRAIAEANLERRRHGIAEDHEFPFRRRDGSTVWTLLSTSPLSAAEGRYVGALAMVVDISERKRAEERIRGALAEKEVLLKEIYHRVKNNLQVVSSLLNLQSRRVADAGAKRLLDDSANRVKAMALVHEQLYGAGNLSSIGLPEYLQQLTDNLQNVNRPLSMRVPLKLEVAEVTVGVESAIPLGLVVNELVSNAYRHGYAADAPGGEIVVRLTALPGGRVCLEVQDDGCGLPADFEPGKTGSLGMQLVVALSQQLGAELTWDAGRQGAGFALRFKPETGATQQMVA